MDLQTGLDGSQKLAIPDLSGRLFHSNRAATAKALSLTGGCSKGLLTKQHLGRGTQATNWDILLEQLSHVYGVCSVQSPENRRQYLELDPLCYGKTVQRS